MLSIFQKFNDYYLILIVLFWVIASISFLLLSPTAKRNKTNLLLYASVFLLFFYENLAVLLLVSKISSNNWVFNFFYAHLASVLILFLFTTYIKTAKIRSLVYSTIVGFLISSVFLHLVGMIDFNDAGELISLISSTVVLTGCFLFFTDLIFNDSYLNSELMKFSGFWVLTSVFLYYATTFMVYISWQYLYTNFGESIQMVFELPRIMALVTTFVYVAILIVRLREEKNQLQTSNS
jgi:hypothetical protein